MAYKLTFLAIIAFLAIKCNAEPVEINNTQIQPRGALKAIIDTVTGIIAEQMKSAMNIIGNIVATLTGLVTEMVGKGMAILNKQLATMLGAIAKMSKDAIVLGVDVSTCTAKETSLFKIVTKLAIPLTTCVKTQVEASVRIVGVIKDKVLETLDTATAFISSVFDCPNLACNMKKYVKLCGMAVSIPIEIADFLWELNKVVVNTTLKCIACQLKIEEKFLAEGGAVVDDIKQCIDKKIEEHIKL